MGWGKARSRWPGAARQSGRLQPVQDAIIAARWGLPWLDLVVKAS